jgi:hypothetical protein
LYSIPDRGLSRYGFVIALKSTYETEKQDRDLKNKSKGWIFDLNRGPTKISALLTPHPALRATFSSRRRLKNSGFP